MILNFNDLNKEETISLNNLFDQIKFNIVEQNELLYKKNQNLHWYFSATSSKDITQTNYIFLICQVLLCIEYCKKNKVSLVKGLNSSQIKIVKKELKKNNLNFPSFRTKPRLSPYFNILKNFFTNLILFYVSKKIFKKFRIKNRVINLTDTFVLPSYYDNGKNDRWFNNLKQFSSKSFFNKNLFFTNVLMGPLKLLKYRKALKLEKDKRLYPESYFKYSFFLRYLRNVIKSLSTNINDFYVSNVDFKDLLKDDLFINIFNTSTYRAWMIYFSFSELKKNKIQIDNAIDWNENQLIDKSLNFSLKKFFPTTKIKGYRCFSTTNKFIYLLNSNFEVENNLSPNELHLGFDYKNKYDNLNISEKINLVDAPNLRSIKIPYTNLDFNKKSKLVLVATPINFDLTKYLFDLVSEIVSKNDLPNFSFNIKLHPNFNINYWIKKYPKLKGMLVKQITDLRSYHSVISSQSSLCLEAYMSSCNVAIYCKKSQLDQIPFYFNNNDIGIKKIYDYNDFLSFIKNAKPFKPNLYHKRLYKTDYKIF